MRVRGANDGLEARRYTMLDYLVIAPAAPANDTARTTTLTWFDHVAAAMAMVVITAVEWLRRAR